MIERHLVRALRDGVEYLKTDPVALKRFFERDQKLSAEEATAIHELFTRDPPTIIIQYPSTESKFPLFSVTLAGENESQQMIGDEGGTIGVVDLDYYDPDEVQAGAIELGSIYTRTYQVVVYAQRPDQCVYYYQIAKLILTRARPDLKDRADVLSMRFAGSDLIPDERYDPHFLFRRQLTITFEQPEQIAGGQPLRADYVTGIHTADQTTTDEARGGVEALVTAVRDDKE